jgi:transcriptional regulator with XRE-family HTH domain
VTKTHTVRTARNNDVSVADVSWKASPHYVRALNRAVGQAIRDARDRRGITQGDLATQVDVSRGSIANIERGEQTLSVPLLLRISGALDVPAEELLREPLESGLDWIRSPQDTPTSLLGVLALDDEDRAKQLEWVSGMLNDAVKRST